MKLISKALEAIGMTSMLVGGCSMDSPSIIIPMIMAFVGVGVMLTGMYLDEAYA